MPIECNERLVVKILKVVGEFLWLLIALYLAQSNFQLGKVLAPLMLVVWLFGVPLLLASAPDVTISDQGITVKVFWKKHFLNWNDVISMRNDLLQTWVLVRKLTPVNYVVGLGIFSLHPAFRLGFEQHNYRRAVEIIRSKIEATKEARS